MRYVLIVAASSVTAYAIGRSGFDTPVIFRSDEQGRQRLCQYFAERFDSVFSVVLDTRDEEHQREIIPSLRGREKARALKQIKTRASGGTVLNACSVTQLTTNGIKKLQVNLSGVAGGMDCAHWIELLRNNAVLVDCICPLSGLVMQVLHTSKESASLCVLRLHHDEYRILGFIKDAPVINRHLNTAASSAEELLNEIGKTREYLLHFESGDLNNGNGNNTETSDVPDQDFASAVLIGLMPSEVKQKLEANGLRVMSGNLLDKKIGKNKLSMSTAMEMIVTLMSDRKVRRATRYSGEYCGHFRARRLNHGLLAGVLCCLGISAAATASAVRISDSYSALLHTTDAQRQRLVAVSAAHRDSDSANTEVLRQSVRLALSIENTMNYSPMHFLSPFSVELSNYPEVNITSVEWNSPPPPELVVHGNSGDKESLTYGYEASVGGHLLFADGELSEAMGQFNSFVHQLQNSSRYQRVEVIEAPFGISDKARTISRSDQTGVATFRIALRVSGSDYEPE